MDEDYETPSGHLVPPLTDSRLFWLRMKTVKRHRFREDCVEA